jgi:hypothetical protein
LRQKAGVKKAMHREEFGYVDFDYGTPGNPNDGFKPGWGISHIQAKHPEDLKDLPKVIADGKVYGHHDPKKRHIILGDSMAVIERRGKTGAYIVTGYEPRAKDLETIKTEFPL